MTFIETPKLGSASSRWTKLWAIACFAIAFGVLLGTLNSANSKVRSAQGPDLAQEDLQR